MSAFADRRATVLEGLGDGVMIVPAATHALRNNDTEYQPVILSDGIPKEIAELDAIVGSGAAAHAR
jgi:hypothetical protein